MKSNKQTFWGMALYTRRVYILLNYLKQKHSNYNLVLIDYGVKN